MSQLDRRSCMDLGPLSRGNRKDPGDPGSRMLLAQPRGRSAALLAVFLALAAAPTARAEGADDLQGTGSTFVAPVMEKWSDEYARISGTKVSYQAIGSGAGIDRIKAGDVDFGATDKPLSPEELDEAGLCQFPLVVGGVVPVVNLPGVAPGQIKFSGKLLGDIYLGRVTRWDAAEIKALNPDLKLPPLPVAVIHRSDGSGTTYNWVDFLAKDNPAWREKVGVGLTVDWPTGAEGEGNQGVAEEVARTPGAIGYVEYDFALQNRLAFGQVENAHGLFVSPSAETFEAAAASVDWSDFRDFSVLMTNAGGAIAYPIAATTFILMDRAPKDEARSDAALAFFKWALEDGGQEAADLDYVAIPPNVVKRIEAYWKSEIKGAVASLRSQ